VNGIFRQHSAVISFIISVLIYVFCACSAHASSSIPLHVYKAARADPINLSEVNAIEYAEDGSDYTISATRLSQIMEEKGYTQIGAVLYALFHL
jgi:hypothetical protein